MEYEKILADFLPDKIFDAHAHLYDETVFGSGGAVYDYDSYLKDYREMLGQERQYTLNFFFIPSVKKLGDPSLSLIPKTDEFVFSELDKHPQNYAELLVLPSESAESIEKRLSHAHISGFKCYHSLIQRKDTSQAEIEEFLPIGAWEVAEKYGKVITLHLMKSASLADENNLDYIVKTAKAFPGATLILAHAARSFATWTGLENVEKLKNIDNIFYDFSAVNESPAVYRIIDKIGVEKCLWGTDYPITTKKGKVVSIADGFYWLTEEDLARLPGAPAPYYYAVENLLAVRQACLMANLKKSQIEKIFYSNAKALFEKATQ